MLIKTDSSGNTQPVIGIQINNSLENEKSFTSKFYPNPFNTQTKISVDLKSNATVGFEIFDLLGKRIYVVNYSLTKGLNEIFLDLNSFALASGIYILKIVNRKDNNLTFHKLSFIK